MYLRYRVTVCAYKFVIFNHKPTLLQHVFQRQTHRCVGWSLIGSVENSNCVHPRGFAGHSDSQLEVWGVLLDRIHLMTGKVL